MNTNYEIYLNKPLYRGEIVEAEYKTQLLKDYNGNPFIEALPIILSPEEARGQMRYHPYFSEDERQLPAHFRIHCVERISDIIEPLNKHFDVEQFISRVIRHGYVNRNPLSIEYTKLLNMGSDAIKTKNTNSIKAFGQLRSTACGQVILGMSGIGKSTVIESVLMLYPQVIIHANYKERRFFSKQVTWLKLECPYDGGIKGLCLKFFKAIDSLLDTNYYNKFGKGKSAEDMLPEMAQVATLHGLGILVIDEIQNLDQAKSGGEKKMLNFFVELINTFSLPVVLIGTYKADFLFSSAFRDARRVSGQVDSIWKNLQNDKEWEILIKTIWQFQWTRTESPLTEKIINTLYDESQGIIDIAVKLFKLAQWRAITTGREFIDERLIRSVAIDNLKLVRPMLNAIKSGNIKEIKQYEDIHIPFEIIESAKMDCIRNLSINNTATTLKQSDNSNKKVEKIVLITDIASWLIQAGVSAEKSALYATKAVDQHEDLTDKKALRKDAFLLANLDMRDCVSETNQASFITENTNNLCNKEISKDKMPDLLNKAKETGKDISQVLKDNNLLKTPSELFQSNTI